MEGFPWVNCSANIECYTHDCIQSLTLTPFLPPPLVFSLVWWCRGENSFLPNITWPRSEKDETWPRFIQPHVGTLTHYTRRMTLAHKNNHELWSCSASWRLWLAINVCGMPIVMLSIAMEDTKINRTWALIFSFCPFKHHVQLCDKLFSQSLPDFAFPPDFPSPEGARSSSCPSWWHHSLSLLAGFSAYSLSG